MIIYGTGGHSFVLFEAAMSMGLDVVGLFDDTPDRAYNEFESVNYSIHRWEKKSLVIGVGDNKARKTIASKVQHVFTEIVHANSYVSPSAKISSGSVVLVKSVVNSRTKIGEHVIINSCSVVDHDCVINDFAHIAPNSTICGHVSIGEGTLIGAGAIVLPNSEIGKWCQIDAGAVVSGIVPDNSRVKANGASAR